MPLETTHARPVQDHPAHLHQLQRRAHERIHALARAADQWRPACRYRGLLRQHGQGSRSDLALCARLRRALAGADPLARIRSEEHTSELQSLMRNSYAVFCLKKKKKRALKDQETRT